MKKTLIFRHAGHLNDLKIPSWPSQSLDGFQTRHTRITIQKGTRTFDKFTNTYAIRPLKRSNELSRGNLQRKFKKKTATKIQHYSKRVSIIHSQHSFHLGWLFTTFLDNKQMTSVWAIMRPAPMQLIGMNFNAMLKCLLYIYFRSRTNSGDLSQDRKLETNLVVDVVARGQWKLDGHQPGWAEAEKSSVFLVPTHYLKPNSYRLLLFFIIPFSFEAGSV